MLLKDDFPVEIRYFWQKYRSLVLFVITFAVIHVVAGCLWYIAPNGKYYTHSKADSGFELIAPLLGWATVFLKFPPYIFIPALAIVGGFAGLATQFLLITLKWPIKLLGIVIWLAAVIGLHFGGSFRKTNYAVKASVIKGAIAKRSWVVVTHELLKIPREAFTEKKRTPESMQNRKGYDSSFLVKKVVLPKIGKSHTVLKTALPNNTLSYTHFSIVMSESWRFPIYTAENLDGELKIKLKRKDSWGYDPRIPKNAQVGHAELYGPEPFDKGHMVRREDVGWGHDKKEAQLGEDDTFIYTNALPQMPQLNQKTWLSLENYILDNAKTEGFKICVFTGPVFRVDDPSYSDIQVPTDFWKMVVAIDADTKQLLVSAYLLSQEGLMPEEGFRYGPFKTYQVPLKRIEELADISFSKPIRDADVFGADEIKEMVTTGRYIEITSVDDIVLTTART